MDLLFINITSEEATNAQQEFYGLWGVLLL